MKLQVTLAAAFAAALSGCATWSVQEAPAAAAASMSADAMLEQIRTLSSDAFGGRLPGSDGEEQTVNYLVRQFRTLGLAPGNPDGRFVQDVALTGIDSDARMKIRARGHSIHFASGRDFVAETSRAEPAIDVADSPLLFVGYGVQAPEYQWDDYKGVDVHGKTLVMLINDPPVADAEHPAQLDDRMFKGRAMTYYGRWTYKFEIASRLGADAVLIVHQTAPAAYPWDVVANSWSGEHFELSTADRNRGRVPVQGWITLAKAQELFRASGENFEALQRAAAKPDFKPVELKAKAEFHLRNKLREVHSQNVVARLNGAEPNGEEILYTAHWDHLGTKAGRHGDRIFNGALDNASGVAGLLQLARAYTRLPQAPRRSVVFMAVTAEEQGLLGSRAYCAQPLAPLAKTWADINMDGLNPWGKTRDLQLVGQGQNDLEALLRKVAARHSRVVTLDAEPEKGFYYRSDQFEFAKAGVPGLYTGAGIDYLGRPAGWGLKKRDDFTAHDYHKPSDEVKPDWNLDGAIADLQILFEVGWNIANGDHRPEWSADSEFRAVREAQLAAAP